MASTYETEEPQAPEALQPEPEPLLILDTGEAAGVCDLDGECR